MLKQLVLHTDVKLTQAPGSRSFETTVQMLNTNQLSCVQRYKTLSCVKDTISPLIGSHKGQHSDSTRKHTYIEPREGREK